MNAKPNRSLSKTILTVFLFALLAVGVLASVQTVRAEAPGTWTQTTQYPFNAYGASCAQSSGTIVCVGGDDFSATTPGVVDTVEYASLSSSGISSWTATTAYPTVIYVPSCVTSGSYIYCVGGSASQNVYYAQVSGSGIVGSWQSTTSYPIPIAGESCVTSGGYITCVGGTEDGASGDAQEVYSAPLENPGIGTWTEQTDFACTSSCESNGSTGIPTADLACVVTGTSSVYVTCIGGEEKISLSGGGYDYPQVGSAFSATLSSGTVGSTWTSTTALPVTTVSGAGSCVSSNGYVYCIAGYDEETDDTAVFYAQSSSGSMGSWTQASDYGQGVSTQQCVVYSSDIYCATGQENTALTPYSYYTTISGSSSTSSSSSTSFSSSSSSTSSSSSISSSTSVTLVCPSTAGGSLMSSGATFVDSYGSTWVAPSGNDGSGGYWSSYFFAGPQSAIPPPMLEGWAGVYGTYNGQQGWIVTFYC